jgi:hypothetical protein
MTFSSRPLSKLAQLPLAAPFAFAIALLGLVSSGCEDKHIGRVCDLDTADAGTTSTSTSSVIQGQAVECPTRICLLPAANVGTNTGPLCTATCSSDDDCSDGETTSDHTSKQCKTGFACLVATTVGNFCCERMCVCKDFIDTTRPDYNKTPTVCQSGATPPSMCKNVH